MTWELIVIGAGAAGLLAAARAAERGRRTLLLERNRQPGIKILMSGGTRCNLTQHTDARGIVTAFGKHGRFLHSALAALGPADLVELVEHEGVATKVEETGKIFPVSDRAADILSAFVGRLQRSGAELALSEPVVAVNRGDAGFVVTTARRVLTAPKVLITTGGQSYPGCGTRGDGFAWCQQLGHTIVPPRPALVPITTHTPWVLALKGITLPDVHVALAWRNRMAESGPHAPRRTDKAWEPAERRGSLLFAHFGLSGPVALDLSRVVSGAVDPQQLELVCDFLPDLSASAWEDQIRNECSAEGKRQVIGMFAHLLPRRVCEAIFETAAVPVDRRAAELTKDERRRLVVQCKQARIPIAGTMGFKKAEVTAGGVTLEEVDSRTMHSRRVENLYLAGEVLDLDGPIGGYNFQAAFSTGWLAGSAV